MSDGTTRQQGTTPRPWRVVGPFYKGIPGKRNTAAPWIAGAGPGQGEKGSSVCKALFIKPGDAALIVAAVNACDGMTEPEREVAELRAAVQVLAQELIEAIWFLFEDPSSVIREARANNNTIAKKALVDAEMKRKTAGVQRAGEVVRE